MISLSFRRNQMTEEDLLTERHVTGVAYGGVESVASSDQRILCHL